MIRHREYVEVRERDIYNIPDVLFLTTEEGTCATKEKELKWLSPFLRDEKYASISTIFKYEGRAQTMTVYRLHRR